MRCLGTWWWRQRAALISIFGGALVLGALVPEAYAHTDPPGATKADVGQALSVHIATGCQDENEITAEDELSECQTVWVHGELNWQGASVTGASSFEGGPWGLETSNGFLADLGDVPCVGDPDNSVDDPNSPGGRGACAGAPSNIISDCIPYVVTAADVARGYVTFSVDWGGDTGFAHLGEDDSPGQRAINSLTINVYSCDDDDLCTTDTCDSVTGDCSNTPVDCTDTDGNLCNTEICDPATGECIIDNPNAVDCTDTDQNLCNTEVCFPDTGTCVIDNPNAVDCTDTDANLCNTEVCAPATGECIIDNPNAVDCTDTDDNLCNTEVCFPDTGTCVIDNPNAVDCSNGLYCDGAETCNAGVCQAGTPVDCNDGVSCTVDSCNDETDSCDNGPDDSSCDDGAWCNGAETCDPAADCQAGTPVDTDDGVGCTDDSCDEVNDMVVNATNDANCDNGAFCDGAETCDPAADCQAGTAPNCDDGVSCTDDACNEETDSCDNSPDDSFCDDGAWCNGAETCDAQLDCQPGTPVDTDDGVGCTDDSCDEVNDVVVNAPNDANCDNGEFCDGTETCDLVNDCQAGTPVDTDDGVGCTDDSCDEVNDVVVNAPNDSNCAGTGDGICEEGVCDPVNDCVISYAGFEGTDCGDDSDTACTNPDSCDGAGSCLPNNVPCASVTDSGLCVFDVSTKGVCVDGGQLTGEACDEADLCVGGACAVTGAGCASDDDCNAVCSQGDCLPENQFKLIFTPDGKIWPGFKLNASNPGQTFYNLIYKGAPTVLTLKVPYPYVTVGGMPVHVYDGAEVGNVPGDDCFDPPAETLVGGALSTQWTIDDWIDGGANNPDVTCDPVCGPNGVGHCTFEVDLTAMEDPDSDEYYVNVHLDYGLEGVHLDANLCDDGLVDRYDVGALSGWGQADAGVPTGGVLLSAHAYVDDDTDSLSVRGLADCRDHVFSYHDGQANFSDTVQNLNIFKGISGAFGLVRSSLTGEGYEGNVLTLAKQSNPTNILSETVTDEDGAYTLLFKHKGKPTMYTVELYDPSGTELLGYIVFELQGNGWTQIEFDADGDPCNADSSFCECNGDWCAAAEYGSGRQSGGSSDGDGGVCEDKQKGETCTDDSDCCSNSCKGKQGSKTCK